MHSRPTLQSDWTTTFCRLPKFVYGIHQTTVACKHEVHREQLRVILDHFSLQVHAESNGGATALKEHDEQDNGREMDASAHQSGGIGGKKTLRVWQSYV